MSFLSFSSKPVIYVLIFLLFKFQGKTLAFLLPALIHIDNQPIPRAERGGANTLILAPTRELALQIEKEVNKYSYRGIKWCVNYPSEIPLILCFCWM